MSIPEPESVAVPEAALSGEPAVADPQEKNAPAAVAAASASLTGQVLTATSHEIRTSLNSIVGMAQLLADSELSKEQRSYIETIRQSSQALFKTLDYVFDVSGTETGLLDTTGTAVDLHALCKDVITAFQPAASDKKIRLSCAAGDNVPLSVMADANLLQHILSNFMRTVLEFSREQSETALNISCAGKDQAGAKVCIELAAPGCILNEGTLEALQADTAGGRDPAQSRKAHSTDLAVSKHLVELMGGTLELSCAPKTGTRLALQLTLPQANRPAPIKLPNMDQGHTIRTPDLRILLAEDNKVNQTATAMMLRKAGCTVDTAENGKAALKLLSNGPEYDLILMDCEMPVMDGYEATTHIREMDEPRNLTPIIALTANAMAQDRQRCLDCGMNDYLPKPVSRKGLFHLINKHTA